jgi:CheY-like chemotaxis protein
MRADLTKVRQSLFNLLSNACKFTHEGTITLAVERVSAWAPPGPLNAGGEPDGAAAGDAIRFHVRDTGIGMTGEQLQTLFEEFTQAEASTTRKYGGTGLGLAISRRFCRMMGGDIVVASVPGQGSTFTITLPVTVRDPKAEAEAAELAAPRAEGGSVVLVIDDDPGVRDLLRRSLGKDGFQVVAAANGEEGLRMAREVRPDAITLDVMMPQMDGWTALAALKADPQLAEIPVVMLTIVDERSVGYSLGAADYLTKPIDRNRLLAVLRRYRRSEPAPTVLLVEDDATTRQMMRRLLEKEGWTVTEAENGREALARVARHVPSLILLDLMMPEMDGFTFLEELRHREAGRAVPVVILTAKDLTPEDRDRLNGHVANVLQKGAQPYEALAAMLRERLAPPGERGTGGTAGGSPFTSP